MRSFEAWSCALLFLLTSLACRDVGAQAPSAPVLTVQAVEAAASAVRADPLLPGTEKGRTLRFKTDENKKPQEAPDFGWWGNLMASLTTGARVAVWLLGAACLVWVLLRLRDWLQRREGGAPAVALAPSHVGSLDIRPESLPVDIGVAARALAQRGDVRAALSLLYRGALSRLVHQHGVPIRAASTEGDCLALAAQRLPAAPQAFLAQLIASWQGVAYAQRRPADEDLELLCAGFEARLSVAPAGRRT